MIKLYYSFKKYDSDTFINMSQKRFANKDTDFKIIRIKGKKPFSDGAEFSLSHTDGLIICAVSESTVGADTEKIRTINNKEKIAEKFLNINSKKLCDEEFLFEWTKFESRIKFCGESIGQKNTHEELKEYTRSIKIKDFVISVCSKSSSILITEEIE